MITPKRVRVLVPMWINVPVELLQKAVNDPLEMSLVALSVAMKSDHVSSAYIFTNEWQFRKHFHLGQTKAHRMLGAIMAGHPLFSVTHSKGHTVITARSFWKLYGSWMTYRNCPVRHMSVVKATLRPRTDLRVTLIEKELRTLMLLTVMNARNRADELQSKGQPLTVAAAHASRTTLSVPYLSKVMGCCSRTVIRCTRQLENDGTIKVQRAPLVRCTALSPTFFDKKPGQTDGRIRIHSLEFQRECNRYQIMLFTTRHRFQHIIRGHLLRYTLNYTLNRGEQVTQSLLHDICD